MNKEKRIRKILSKDIPQDIVNDMLKHPENYIDSNSEENWKGCFISESLKDPGILNNFKCYRFYITGDQNVLDSKGSLGRWHMYWIEAEKSAFDLFKANINYNWYGHFWKGNDITAVFENKLFKLEKDDKNTWADAIAFGKEQGILEEQLDFLTD